MEDGFLEQYHQVVVSEKADDRAKLLQKLQLLTVHPSLVPMDTAAQRALIENTKSRGKKKKVEHAESLQWCRENLPKYVAIAHLPDPGFERMSFMLFKLPEPNSKASGTSDVETNYRLVPASVLHKFNVSPKEGPYSPYTLQTMHDRTNFIDGYAYPPDARFIRGKLTKKRKHGETKGGDEEKPKKTATTAGKKNQKKKQKQKKKKQKKDSDSAEDASDDEEEDEESPFADTDEPLDLVTAATPPPPASQNGDADAMDLDDDDDNNHRRHNNLLSMAPEPWPLSNGHRSFVALLKEADVRRRRSDVAPHAYIQPEKTTPDQTYPGPWLVPVMPFAEETSTKVAWANFTDRLADPRNVDLMVQALMTPGGKLTPVTVAMVMTSRNIINAPARFVAQARTPHVGQ